MRARSSGTVDAQALCRDCPWSTYSYKNALALAARHTDAYGHVVEATQTLMVVYGPPGSTPTDHKPQPDSAAGG